MPRTGVLLSRTRELSLRAQRRRGADIRARIHHHLPVLTPCRTPPIGHPDTRVARRTERVGRGRQRHRLSRTGRYGTPATAHGPALVDRRRRRRHKAAVNVLLPRWQEDVMMMMLYDDSLLCSFLLRRSTLWCSLYTLAGNLFFESSSSRLHRTHASPPSLPCQRTFD